MTNFGVYIIGFVIVILGVALGAHMLGLPNMWIGIGVIILLGIGVLTGITKTKRPDPPAGGPGQV